MNLPVLTAAQAAIEAGMVAAGWRTKHREPWPCIEYRKDGEPATSTMWYAVKPALGTEITCQFEIPDDVLEDETGDLDGIVGYYVDRANAEYAQLIHERVSA